MTDLLTTLQEFRRERVAMLLAHEASARQVRQYEANNTYQYIINREETQLSWLDAAIRELGGTISDDAEPSRRVAAKSNDEAARRIFEDDAREAQAFVERWRPRIEAMPNARQSRMLKLILGEVLEQKRFFDQALEGRHDLLGRRAEQLGPSHGEVLSSRWVE